MLDSSVARRYARALFTLEAGTSARTHDNRQKSLAQFVTVLEGAEDLRAALLGPGLPAAQKQELVDVLAKEIGATAVLQAFFHILVDRQRLSAIPAIAAAYRELADAQAGRVRAQVTAPYPLTQAQIGHLEESLSAATSKEVVISAGIDQRLIGGLVAEVGGTRFDSSLQTQLLTLRQELLDKSL